MEVSELQERLRKLDADKLIDVVKNYRQYGYTDAIRNYALTILEERGINKNDLQLTGNYENKTYDFAIDLYASFKRNSANAFICYALLILIKFGAPHLGVSSNYSAMVIITIYILSLAIYFIFLVRSFLNQSEFYKLSGDDFGLGGTLLYLFLGMPFYFPMYFVFKNQMKEKMKVIA